MSVVVKVENVSKKYHLGKTATNSLKGDFQRWWARKQGKEDPFSKVVDASQLQGEEFWALKDINFEVRQGEAVGIIGKNGAGKSTLLKILSRITLPTTGSIKIKGRIASLLEVGTGFNPDLSGRENVYLNGAILGMTKAEINQKFDEIVDFAGIERFIDTPVKRYSSGMYVRLAFAVAAHLESEILILDEVLAVGDAEFQKKCLGKMDDVAHKQGRTILFVSHNMLSVESLCNQGVLLKKGKVITTGGIRKIIDYYNQETAPVVDKALAEREDRNGSGIIRFHSFELRNWNNNPTGNFITGKNAKIVIYFKNNAKKKLKNFFIALGINNAQGQRITNLNSEITGNVYSDVAETAQIVEVNIDRLPFTPGKYEVTLYCTIDGQVADWVNNAFSFYVEPGDFYGTGRLIPENQGNILIEHSFKITEKLEVLQ
ncbi:ABC transporter ATP-binding protein [Xanthocytophaga flava]|uniref:ABC transporter ATP-binding protein n=1 Tax=Xanthocytophaga flava TaxID=3048013 RepID=UPI0028D71A91|nr:ABC transporter ATP-binding protein [Xanthocytophaga flavus]MDJ1471633.1 ABC transporter ATP-binding protein [Xanthocytophaga flavus]